MRRRSEDQRKESRKQFKNENSVVCLNDGDWADQADLRYVHGPCYETGLSGNKGVIVVSCVAVPWAPYSYYAMDTDPQALLT
jgi:hypothetical protein